MSTVTTLVDIRKELQKYFAHVESDDPNDHNKLRCLIPKCTSILQYRKRHGWYAFERHLTSVHDILAETLKIKSTTNTCLDSFVVKKWKATPKARLYARLTRFERNFVDFIAIDGVPISIGTRLGFRKMIQGIDYRLRIPSTFQVLRLLNSEYEKTRKTYRELLRKRGDGSVHLCLDLWSSIQMMSVLGVKVQFIDADWSIRNFTIGFKHFEDSATGLNLNNKLKDLLLMEYGMQLDEFGTIMADNAADMVKAFSTKDGLVIDHASDESETETSDSESDNSEGDTVTNWVDDEDSEIECDNRNLTEVEVLENSFPGLHLNLRQSYTRLGCNAHALQLVVNECLKKNPKACEITTLIKDLVTFFRMSNFWSNKLYSKTKLRLVRPGTTRWNSMFYAMKRLLKENFVLHLNEVLEEANREKRAGKKMKSPPAMITDSMLCDIKGLTELLLPICDLTNDLQGDGVTSSLVIPGLIAAYKCLAQISISPEASEYIRAMRASICLTLAERFGSEKEYHYSGRGPRKQLLQVFKKKEYVLATILDPRMKTKPFSVKLDEPYTLDKYVLSRDEAVKLLFDNMKINLPEPNEEVETVEPICKKSKSYGMFEMINQVQVAETSMRQGPPEESAINGEVDVYLNEECIRENSNPLDYWRRMAGTLPHLAKLAKTYLAIPASSGGAERLFSVAGSIARARRARLKIKNLEQLLVHKERRNHELF